MNRRQSTTSARRDVVTAVALPQSMRDALDKEAQRSQIYSRSALIRAAIQEFLEHRADRQATEEKS